MEKYLLILSVVPLFALSLLMFRNTNTDSSKKIAGHYSPTPKAAMFRLPQCLDFFYTINIPSISEIQKNA